MVLSLGNPPSQHAAQCEVALNILRCVLKPPSGKSLLNSVYLKQGENQWEDLGMRRNQKSFLAQTSFLL